MDENTKLAYIEKCFEAIFQKKDVLDVVVMNEKCDPIKSSMKDENITLSYSGLFGILMLKARKFLQEIDENDDLISMRVRSEKHETLITPDNDITFITIQCPVEKNN